MKRIICFLVLIVSGIFFISCTEEGWVKLRAYWEERSFSETHTGKGTLAFTAEGMKVHQSMPYFMPPGTAYWTIIGDNQIKIMAFLNNKAFHDISLVFPAEELKTDAIIHPEADLRYFYKTKPQANNPLRLRLYDNVTVSDAVINITFYEKDIISGRFTLEGEYADSTGKFHVVDIKDGIFDLAFEIIGETTGYWK